MRAAVIPVQPLDPGFLEPHYTVPQLAENWHLAPGTVRRMFENEAGVMKLGHETQKKGRTYVRHYSKMRIPESVLERVKARRSLHARALARDGSDSAAAA